MNLKDLQRLIGATPDGQFGPQSRRCFMAVVTNAEHKRLSEDDFAAAAHQLGCTRQQIAAVWQVLGARHGFDDDGRPLMLFSRSRFFELTGGLMALPSSACLSRVGTSCGVEAF